VGLRIGFIMDPFERLDSIDEDTSCCLIMECLRRGHTVFYLQIEDLELRVATAWGCVSKILKRQEDKFVMAQPKMMNWINSRRYLCVKTLLGKRFVIAQEYLPRVREGDKRILLLEGKPLGAMCRVPPPDDYRANIHRGARFTRARIGPHDEKICQCLSTRLVKKIVEINVTSPGGIPEINGLNRTNLEKVVIDWLEEKIKEFSCANEIKREIRR